MSAQPISFRLSKGSYLTVYGMGSKAVQTVVDFSKQESYEYWGSRFFGQLTHSRYHGNEGEWMVSNGKQVVLLGHADGGAVITVSMKIRERANLREYQLRILEQNDTSVKIGARNPHDGIGLPEMIVISLSDNKP